MKPRKEYLSIKELAAELDMSSSWTDKKVRSGKIKFVWIGGVRKVPKEELLRIKKEGVE